MVSTNSIAEVASLVGDPGRASILQALMNGRALTATELARVAGVAPQTASGHLCQLTAAGLLSVQKQGRHRYFRLATIRVVRVFEALAEVVAETGQVSDHQVVTGPMDVALRTARTCFDHLAGRLGVALADALSEQGLVELADDGGIVTQRGVAFFRDAGIRWDDRPPHRSGRFSLVCRTCIDWSERRFHIAGRLGAALCRHSLEAGWVRRHEASRALDITRVGRQAFQEIFGVNLAGEAPSGTSRFALHRGDVTPPQ